MKKNVMFMIVRIFVGLVFTMTGAMKLFPMKQPEIPGVAGEFMKGLLASGYFLPLLGITELIVGLMLLFNLWSALAAVMLAPITLNIFLYHTILDPSALAIGVLCILFNIYLLYYHRDKFEPLLKRK